MKIAVLFQALLGLLLVATVGAQTPPGPKQEDELRIHFLNTGTGSCQLVECPGPGSPSPILLDCGRFAGISSHSMTEQGARTYIQDIFSRYTEPPIVVVSHGDSDHFRYIPTVMQDTSPKSIWLMKHGVS